MDDDRGAAGHKFLDDEGIVVLWIQRKESIDFFRHNQEGDTMASINPYLNFPGNTEEAFNFYKSVFGGDFLDLQRFSDTPHAGDVPEADKSKIMHVSLPIGKGNLLMGTDALETFGQKITV